MNNSTSCGEALVSLLSGYGFDTVFGIPGTHSVELYRGLHSNKLRHILARHEQGAAFMADGYARASGKPGLCFLITGPGITNAATGIAQAYTDSIPMLVISPVNESWSLGKSYGRLHEIDDQRAITRPVTGAGGTAMVTNELPTLLTKAMDMFNAERPRPAHIQIPLDVFKHAVTEDWMPETLRSKRLPSQKAVEQVAKVLKQAKFPVIIVGGGAIEAGKSIRMIAEALAAPVVTTIAAKGVLPSSHPLSLGSTLTLAPTQELVSQADVVLTLGSDLAQTDIWNDEFSIGGTHIRVDIDAQELRDDHPADVAVHADAVATADMLAQLLDQSPNEYQFSQRAELVAELHATMHDALTPKQKAHMRCLMQMSEALPDDAIVVGDMAQVIYTANRFMPFEQPGCYFHPVGFGTLGYALPAAIGAKVAAPDRIVVAVAGDYGFMFSAQEMLTAAEEGIDIVVVVWNNNGLAQIRDDMDDLDVQPTGVSARSPDFMKMAESFGWQACRVDDPDKVAHTLSVAIAQSGPTLIEINENIFIE